ncbi:Asp-tRNA(Asn)/Glu-tRNA(Gln) amidotransferase subunit GatC, partial [Thermodesulfobacteriota bacterium]
MKITRDEVIHVANLARLDLDEAAIDTFAEQIGTILEYVDTLKRVDTEGVAPTSHAISLTNAFREDTVTDDFDRDSALANA